MRKLLSFILIYIVAFGSAEAQNPLCNAGFQFTFQNPTEVKFFPASADTVSTTHTWTFGDNTGSNLPSPSHVYQAPGTYTVVHTVIVYSNGVVVCTNSFTAIVTIQNTNTCLLSAHFSWMQDSTSYAVYFQNNSTPTNLSDSVRWSFGDGTSAGTYHATHTYSYPGTYQACLRIWQRVNGIVNLNCFSEQCANIVVSAPSTCNLNLSFNYTGAGNALNSFIFNNTSFGISQGDSIRWTYGDGSSSNSYNGSHTYNAPGTYQVCLRVIKRDPSGALSSCVREYCRAIAVQSVCNLHAAFTAQTDSLTTNAIFTNTSSGASNTDSVRWNFGDGSSSGAFNTSHAYAAPGSYNVCLIIYRRDSLGHITNCASDICQTIHVGTVCNLQITFTTSPVTAQPNSFTFNAVVPGYNTSTDSVFWSYGDSTFGLGMNTTHTYANPGTYRVCVKVKRTIPGSTVNCIRESCQTITVAPPCNLIAAFSHTADTSNGLIIYFSNLSNVSVTQGAMANWSFGDGTTATAWNPSHNYQAPGTYVVCLRIQSSSACVRTFCDSIQVLGTGNPCYVNSEFTFVTSAANSQSLTFIPHTTNGTAYYWSFGDSTFSQDSMPTHVYTSPGTYNVCLTVTISPTCSSTTCRMLVVRSPFTCDSVRVSFSSRKDPFYKNKVYFNTQTNYPVLDETWTITRLPLTATTMPVIIHRYNPSYYFRDTGTYSVCLRAVTLGGCVKESCDTIRIDTLVAGPNPCFLQVYPNPTSSQINISLSLNQPDVIHVYVYNYMNMQVQETHVPGSAGWNTIGMYVGNLMPGYYFIRVVYGNSTCFARFFKY